VSDTEPQDPAQSPEQPTSGERADLHQSIVAALKTCYDPEIPVDIYELGLIYEIDASEPAKVRIRMTLTSPMCPVAESLPLEVKDKVARVPGVGDVEIDLVWEPQWDPSLMSEAARLELGF
jgi:FeS assembly SUF system protein